MCHSGCRRHKETLFSCGPSVHCRAKQRRGGLQSDCLGSSLDFETAIQMHICWFELCPFKTVGKRHWMTLKPDWIYDCSKESRIFSFCCQPAISVHQWTDECLPFSNNTVMAWLSSCFSFSVYIMRAFRVLAKQRLFGSLCSWHTYFSLCVWERGTEGLWGCPVSLEGYSLSLYFLISPKATLDP